MKTTRIYTILAISLLLMIGSSLRADVSIHSFAGTWINERANISKISIEIDHGAASVLVWGLSEEGPCKLSSDDSYDRVGNNGAELLASVKNVELEAYMMMRLQGERLEVRVVSRSKEGEQVVTKKFMSSYSREITMVSSDDSTLPSGGIQGLISGPASSTASIFQVVLLAEDGQQFLDRMPLSAQAGFSFNHLEDGIYNLQIESNEETVVRAVPAKFEVEIQNGQLISRTIHLE